MKQLTLVADALRARLGRAVTGQVALFTAVLQDVSKSDNDGGERAALRSIFEIDPGCNRCFN